MLGKIAFLFLTITDPYHSSYWQDFFRGHEHMYSIYVHAKYRVYDPFFKDFVIKKKYPNDWGHVTRVKLGLLEHALQDPVNQKFIFISDTTIPVAQFATVYELIMSHEKSIFKYYKNPYLDSQSQNYWPERKIAHAPITCQYKNSAWVVLNRAHAELVVTTYNKKYLSPPCYIDNEHYFSTILALNGKLAEVENKNAYYVNWDHKEPDGRFPFTFTDLTSEQEQKLLKNVFSGRWLFARKFAKRCDLSVIDKLLPYK